MSEAFGYTKFLSLKKHGFSLNTEVLFDLYQPIIGPEATKIFIALFHECRKQNASSGLANEIGMFFHANGISPNSFKSFCAKLEAMGLMTTYAEKNENDLENKYIFLLNEPLSFVSFISNQRFRHLLIKNIGQTNYERLEYIYQSSFGLDNAVNISSTFEMVFNDEEISKVKTFNFDNLYEDMLKNTSMSIILTDSSKQTIETYFKNYNLTIGEIEKCLYAAVVRGENGSECIVDDTVLRIRLQELINSSRKVEIFKNIRVNRNAKMFLQYMNQNDIQNVFNDYTNMNSEQYLNAIMKVSLSKDEQKTIQILRTEYSLCDYVINMLIDFTLLKSNGRLNVNYITKVAKTINALNLNNLSDIYNYLLNNKASSNETVEEKASIQAKINWDGLPQ